MDGDFAKRIDLTSRNKTVGLDGRTPKFDWCSFAPLNFVNGAPLHGLGELDLNGIMEVPY